MKNEIIDEVREARAALAAEHGYDRQKIYEWARATTAAHKHAQSNANPNNKTLETTGGARKSSVVRKRRVRPASVST